MRRRLLAALGLLLLLAVAASAWVGFRGLAARDELQAARASLSTARAALLDQQTDVARARMQDAGLRTARARELTSDPVFRVAARLPLVGRSVRVARELPRTADVVARELLPEALAVAEQVDPAQLRAPDGTVAVARLQQAQPRLAALAVRTAELVAEVDELPRARVLAPVARGRDDLADQLTELADATDAAAQSVALASPLLGADRPRRYFVLVQQTSESRGTGGLPGGFAILEARGGQLVVTAQGSNADLRNGPVPVPPGVPADYVDLYEPQGAFAIWQNVNLSPDLPVVARVVAARWKQQSGQDVDGVIALDAIALADLLRGSGPIDLGDRAIAPEELPDYLAIGQYREFTALDRQGARKEKLTTVARAATARVTRGGGSTPDLLRGLVDAVRSGHLRMASDDPVLQPLLERAGVTGALPRDDAPLAYPVVFNGSAGKLDYFLDRTVSYTAGPCTGLTRRSTIRVGLRNDAPGSGLPPYLTIFTTVNGQKQSTLNGVVLAVYGTRGAEFAGATLDGEPVSPIELRPGGPVLRQSTEAGLPRWHVFLDLPRGEDRTLELTLDEPLVAGAPRVIEQPLARPLRTTVDVPPC